jgi:hypothetical protein
MTLNILPSSPEASARDRDPIRDSKSRKKSKRRRSPSTTSDSSDSETERRRRERKEKRRARKEKEREREKRDNDRKKRSYDSDEDEREQNRRSRKRTRSRSKSQSKTKRSQSRSATPERPPRSEYDEEDEWVEKPAEAASFVALTAPRKSNVSAIKHAGHVDDLNSEDDDVGPQPIQKLTSSKKVDERSYGGALLRGEGSAMAAFLAEDSEARIPRRGEIGLTSDEIAKFEDVGYVMSGSRHRRMNAVRMRKENQVISAEEKRGILKLQKEERERREAILREEFGELVKERLSGQDKRK